MNPLERVQNIKIERGKAVIRQELTKKQVEQRIDMITQGIVSINEEIANLQEQKVTKEAKLTELNNIIAQL